MVQTLRFIGVGMVLAVIMSACNHPNYHYIGSVINLDFPVPSIAEYVDNEFENPLVKKYVKYEMKGFSSEGQLVVPDYYLQEIKKWGWQEIEEDRTTYHYKFKKEKATIWLSIQEDSFSLSQLDEK